MTNRLSRLKNPSTPPLIEVALTAQFEPIEALGSAQMGRLWGAVYREDFPNVEEHPPVDHIVELRGPVLSHRPRFVVEAAPMPSRMFFVNDAGSELVQLQRDRFSYNWRKRGSSYDYQRYETTRDAFAARFKRFSRFVSEEKLGEISIDQCELTYVNHVALQSEATGSAHRGIGDLIRPWHADYDNLAGSELEDVNLAVRHLMRDAAGEFIGRLIVTVEPRFLIADKTPLYKIQFTARGTPSGPDLQSALEFLNTGHSQLLRGFAEFMSPEVQAEWRQHHGS